MSFFVKGMKEEIMADKKKTTGIIVGVVAVAALGLTGCSSLGNSEGSSEPAPTSSVVATERDKFNDGFAAAELYDCQTADEIMDLMGCYPAQTDFSAALGMELTFTGKTNATQTNADEVVFYSKANHYTIAAPFPNDFKNAQEVTVSGKISEITELKMTLSDVEVTVPENDVPAETAPAATTAATTAADERVVFVSNTGKYHITSDCSGMTEYTEMTLAEAKAAGYEPCGRCW